MLLLLVKIYAQITTSNPTINKITLETRNFLLVILIGE